MKKYSKGYKKGNRLIVKLESDNKKNINLQNGVKIPFGLDQIR